MLRFACSAPHDASRSWTSRWRKRLERGGRARASSSWGARTRSSSTSSMPGMSGLELCRRSRPTRPPGRRHRAALRLGRRPAVARGVERCRRVPAEAVQPARAPRRRRAPDRRRRSRAAAALARARTGTSSSSCSTHATSATCWRSSAASASSSRTPTRRPSPRSRARSSPRTRARARTRNASSATRSSWRGRSARIWSTTRAPSTASCSTTSARSGSPTASCRSRAR